MLPKTPIEEFDAELNRVVTRLRSIPIDHLGRAQPIFEELASALLDCSATLGDSAPIELLGVTPRAYADVIAVLARDVRGAAIEETQLIPATLALTHARRALP